MGDIVGGLFGGGGDPKAAVSNYKPGGFRTNSLKARYTPSGYKIEQTKGGRGRIRRLADLFRTEAGVIRDELLPQVKPGFGRLTQARVNTIQDARRRAVGDLRDNLQRRRVLGSSFAQDAIARAESEFARQEETARAESFLQELQLTQELIGREYEQRRNAVQSIINQANFEADLGAGLSRSANEILARNAQMEGELAAREAEGSGSFLGTLINAGVSLATA